MTTSGDPDRCLACGAPTTPRARYCEACGHELAAPDQAESAIVGIESATVAAGAANDMTGTAVPEPASSSAGSLDATDAGDTDGATPSPVYGTSAPPPPECPSCRHDQINTDGYCDHCGTRRPSAAAHSDVDLGGLAGVSDIGSRHHHNEDAMGLAAFGGTTAAVVCDGVSSSSRPDTAATAAALAATNVFVTALPALAAAAGDADAAAHGIASTAADAAAEIASTDAAADADTRAAGTDDAEVRPAADAADRLTTTDDVGTHEVSRGGAAAMLHDAVAASQAAAAQAAGDDMNPNPPSTTFVAAVVTTGDITIGWVGDSRVYWVPDAGTPGGASCLTVDDTLAGQLGAAGVAMAADAPNAGALIRWLGADAADTEPHIVTLVPPGPGRVIVCSDGLYRYAPQPDQLADVTPIGRPIEVASALVRLALEAGGHDNVTVVVLPYPPEVAVHASGGQPDRSPD